MSAHSGRPTRREARARTHELVRHLADGKPLHEAAQLAHVDPARVLRLLGDDAFFHVYQAVREGHLGVTAALVHLPAELPDAEAA